MYTLQIFRSGSEAPDVSFSVPRGAAAIERVFQIFQEHTDCARVTVLDGDRELFSLDRRGDRLSD